MCVSCSMRVKSEKCVTFMKQNVAGMQVFSVTVGQLGPSGSNQVTNGSKLGQAWVKCGSRESPGSCLWVCGSCAS